MPSRPTTTPASVRETQAALQRMERRDWSRLMIFLTIVGLLTVVIWFLTSEYHGPVTSAEVHVAITGLIAIVLLFSLFAVYQQRITANVRRQLAENIALAATLEAVQPSIQPASTPEQRRHHMRYYFDEMVRVHGGADRTIAQVFGRTSNLSEGGVAAVIPATLEPGTAVVVEFPGEKGEKFSCGAIVRHRRGFLHGLEFSHVSNEQRQELRGICGRLAPVEFRDVNPDPASAGSAERPRSTTGVLAR